MKSFLYKIVFLVLFLSSWPGFAEDSSPSASKAIAQNDTAQVPTGIYVMVRPAEIMKPGYLEEIIKNKWVTALSVGLEWDVVFPDSLDMSDYSSLDSLLSRIDAACKSVGRTPIPIFLKTYPLLPSWMELDYPAGKWDDGASVNKAGILVVKRPAYRDASGLSIPARDYPISTDRKYAEVLYMFMKKIAVWLDRVDPKAIRIPLINVMGPAMESNTMRPPKIDFFWYEGNVQAKKSGWSKESHIAAWINISSKMANYSAFRARYWVFNVTSLVPQSFSLGKQLALSIEDQAKVIDRLRSVHPLGASHVLLKTEDLTVNFNDIGGVKSAMPGGSWRRKFLQQNAYPYYYIARQFGEHGWELWASFDMKRDKRASSLFPLRELMNNSLYLDLGSDNQKMAQGTLWVEIWPDDVANISSIKTNDPIYKTLNEFFYAWSRELNSVLH